MHIQQDDLSCMFYDSVVYQILALSEEILKFYKGIVFINIRTDVLEMFWK